MAANARYFVTDVRGTFIDWAAYFQGFSLLGREIQVTGGAGDDRIAVQAGASADLTNLGGGVNRIVLSGALGDYAQSIDQSTGVYTFTRVQGLPSGGAEVVRFTVGDKNDVVMFADGGIVINGAEDARLVDLQTFEFSPIQQAWLDPVQASSNGRPTGASEAGSPLRVFIAGTEGLDVPALPQPGLAMALVGSGGVDTVYVGPGTVVNATNLGGGNDRIYLSGRFTDYTQSIVQDTGVYTFSRAVDGKTERVEFTVSDQDDAVFFADGHIVVNGLADPRLVDIDTFAFNPIQAAWLVAGGTPLPATPQATQIQDIVRASGYTDAVDAATFQFTSSNLDDWLDGFPPLMVIEVQTRDAATIVDEQEDNELKFGREFVAGPEGDPGTTRVFFRFDTNPAVGQVQPGELTEFSYTGNVFDQFVPASLTFSG